MLPLVAIIDYFAETQRRNIKIRVLKMWKKHKQHKIENGTVSKAKKCIIRRSNQEYPMFGSVKSMKGRIGELESRAYASLRNACLV